MYKRVGDAVGFESKGQLVAVLEQGTVTILTTGKSVNLESLEDEIDSSIAWMEANGYCSCDKECHCFEQRHKDLYAFDRYVSVNTIHRTCNGCDVQNLVALEEAISHLVREEGAPLEVKAQISIIRSYIKQKRG